MHRLFLLTLIGLLSALAVAKDESASILPPPKVRMSFQTFDDALLPKNRNGEGLPSAYGGQGGGKFMTLSSADGVAGRSLLMKLSEGGLYAQFNPYGPTGRAFARDYCTQPKAWRFNTYNRFRFWIKVPESAPPPPTNGDFLFHFGTYVKRVSNPDLRSDETGNGHYYHLFNVANTGTWTQVILNMHPSHLRGNSGGIDPGHLPQPTGEPNVNYFDALTRFYIQSSAAPTTYPADYVLDEMEFYQEPNKENDAQVYSMTGTFVPRKNRVFITWSRPKDENKTRHEVRYAFDSIHKIGWTRATPAPKGIVAPLGWQGYNGMTYDSSALPLARRKLVYIGIRPENSKVFSQIAIPLRGAL